MKISPNAPCPCHSGAKYKKCCRPYHYGTPALTPEILMRSRYAAYALGKPKVMKGWHWMTCDYGFHDDVGRSTTGPKHRHIFTVIAQK